MVSSHDIHLLSYAIKIINIDDSSEYIGFDSFAVYEFVF